MEKIPKKIKYSPETYQKNKTVIKKHQKKYYNKNKNEIIYKTRLRTFNNNNLPNLLSKFLYSLYISGGLLIKDEELINEFINKTKKEFEDKMKEKYNIY